MLIFKSIQQGIRFRTPGNSQINDKMIKWVQETKWYRLVTVEPTVNFSFVSYPFFHTGNVLPPDDIKAILSLFFSLIYIAHEIRQMI